MRFRYVYWPDAVIAQHGFELDRVKANTDRPHHFMLPTTSTYEELDTLLKEVKQWMAENLKKSVRKRANYKLNWTRRRVEIRDDNDAVAFRVRWC